MDEQRPILSLDEELAYFNTIPWCRASLSRDDVITIPRLSAIKHEPMHSDHLFKYTLNTPLAVPHSLIAFPDPSVTRPTSLANNDTSPWLPLTSLSMFYALGDGLCGFQDLCHGGVQATLLDEVAGVLAIINVRLQNGIATTKYPERCSPDSNPGMLDLRKSLFATQGMEITFLRPLRLPKVVEVAVQVPGHVTGWQWIYHFWCDQRWRWKRVLKVQGHLGDTTAKGQAVTKPATTSPKPPSSSKFGQPPAVR
ncbi:hypothetical protein CC79DRAFT_1365193 [Sarocladium strictum]